MAPHLAAIDRALVETIQGQTAPILIIEAPPRHGKSELISRYLPAWYLGHNPDRRVMLAGYAAGFARSWGRKARAVLAEHGRDCFDVEIDRAASAAADWGLCGHDGGMVTAGIGGPLTGRGANLLIIDDPIKNSDQTRSDAICESHWDWWQSTASTRIEPGGCAVIIATRWAVNDLSGRLIRQAEREGGPRVRRLRLPAIAEDNDPLGRAPGSALWPERWPLERLERLRAEKEERWWLALYQQRPPRYTGGLWPDSYFDDHLWVSDLPRDFDFSVIALDPAKGTPNGDHSAIVFAGSSGGAFWIDAKLGRLAPEATIAAALEMVRHYTPHAVVIESNMFQSLLGPEFDRQCGNRGLPPQSVHLVEQRAPKEMRISGLGPLLLQRKLRIRRSADCETLVNQLRQFPRGERDDGPDALELAIRQVQVLAGGTHDDPDFTWDLALL